MSEVTGYCPMGCGPTLFLSDAGHVTCGFIDCPNPAAVDEILRDRETEHVVALTEENFTVRHPLRERVADELLDCDLHHYLTSLEGPPATPGRYRARRGYETYHHPWVFERLRESGS